MRRSTRLGVSATVAAALLLSAGCAAKSEPKSTGSASASSCTPAKLATHSKNTLTVATDSPAYPPWYIDNKPTNGKGYESAVAYAVAKQLGYSVSQVTWVKATFNSVIAPTPKKYDFDINQVSMTAARAKVVDFSSGYYDVTQVVITLAKSKYATATSVAALKGAKLGAQQGTTSFDAITEQIKPSRQPSEYPTNDLAVQALKNGQIDGLVVDLPTGFYITSAELDGAKIVGQLPVSGQPEQFGLVLSKGSALTSCVSRAVNQLRSNGTLAALTKQWLTGAGAPVLK